MCGDEALADARAKTDAPAEAPFHGVPISLKDLDTTAGIRTTFSCPAFAANVPDFDLAHVAKLRAAGFVILGKTNTPEFGTTAFTDSALNGPCRTPWDLSRNAGGSSGGAGAALAAGLCAISQGSDGGGSLRIPGSCCGVLGFKASRGRVSNAPFAPGIGLGTTGPLARTTADAAAYLDVVGGYEWGDPFPPPPPERPYRGGDRSRSGPAARGADDGGAERRRGGRQPASPRRETRPSCSPPSATRSRRRRPTGAAPS